MERRRTYADDTTIYVVKENKDSVINALEISSLLLFKWFSINFIKAISGKIHVLLSSRELSTIVIDSCSIESNIKKVL